MKQRNKAYVLGLLAAFSLTLAGCIPSAGDEKTAAAVAAAKSGGAGTGGGGSVVPQGLAEAPAFAQTLHIQIQSRSCKTCHSVSTLSQAPLLAETDSATSWNALKSAGKVNLLSPASSAIVAKMQMGHNCGDAGACVAAANAFTTAINNMSVLMQTPSGGGGGGGGGGGDTTVPGLSSTEAFRQSLWPVLRTAPATCTGCHGNAGPRAPYASSNLQSAHDALVGGGLVILNDPSRAGQSAIVQKIAGGHEGHPVALATTIQAQIVTWRALMQPTTIPGGGGGNFGTREASAEISLPVLPANMIYAEAESGTLTQFVVSANNLASGQSLITTPANTGANMGTAANSTRIARYTIAITQAGNYRIWGRTVAPTANDNSFHVRVDTGAFQNWQLPVDPNGPVWNLVNNNNAVQTFTLTAGNHTIEVRQNEDGAGLDKLLVTSDNAFTPVGQGSRTLEFNVGQLAGLTNTLFRVDVADFDQFSYMFANPRLVVPTGGSVLVKDVMLHLNNVFNAGDATFTVIDDEVAAPGGALNNEGTLPANLSLIVVKGANPAMDKFKVSFEMIQAR